MVSASANQFAIAAVAIGDAQGKNSVALASEHVMFSIPDDDRCVEVQVTPFQYETDGIGLPCKPTVTFGSGDVFKMVAQRVCRQDLLRDGGVF